MELSCPSRVSSATSFSLLIPGQQPGSPLLLTLPHLPPSPFPAWLLGCRQLRERGQRATFYAQPHSRRIFISHMLGCWSPSPSLEQWNPSQSGYSSRNAAMAGILSLSSRDDFFPSGGSLDPISDLAAGESLLLWGGHEWGINWSTSPSPE